MAAQVDYVSAGYADHYGVTRTNDWVLLKLTEEVGELVQAHLTSSGQGRDRGLDPQQQRQQVEIELADVIGMCFVFARQNGIDIDRAVQAKWLQYERFHRDRGFEYDPPAT